MRLIPPKITYHTATDGYRLACRQWMPSQPVGHVVLLHGIISHSGWYLQTGSCLADEGIAVHALDRRGSGLNVEASGDAPSLVRLLEDVEEYIAALPSGRPVLLAGISWGGVLATAIAQRHPERLAGLVLICPGLFSRKGTSRLQHRAVRAANRIGLGRRKAKVPLQAPELFTDAPAWQEYIRHDPLTLRMVTLRFAWISAQLYALATAAPEAIRTPTLLMLAGKDRLIRNDQVRGFVERFATDDRQIAYYANAAHTLEFEPDPAPYHRDLARWSHRICGTG